MTATASRLDRSRSVVETIDNVHVHRVLKELDALSADVRQRFSRISELIEQHGIAAMQEPHIKHWEGKLWEMRMKGRDGIARAIYVTATGERVQVVYCIREEDPEDAPPSFGNRTKSCEGGEVMGIPLEEVAKRWLKGPEFKAGYDALHEGLRACLFVSLLPRFRARFRRPRLTGRNSTSGTPSSTAFIMASSTGVERRIVKTRPLQAESVEPPAGEDPGPGERGSAS